MLIFSTVIIITPYAHDPNSFLSLTLVRFALFGLSISQFHTSVFGWRWGVGLLRNLRQVICQSTQIPFLRSGIQLDWI